MQQLCLKRCKSLGVIYFDCLRLTSVYIYRYLYTQFCFHMGIRALKPVLPRARRLLVSTEWLLSLAIWLPRYVKLSTHSISASISFIFGGDGLLNLDTRMASVLSSLIFIPKVRVTTSRLSDLVWSPANGSGEHVDVVCAYQLVDYDPSYRCPIGCFKMWNYTVEEEIEHVRREDASLQNIAEIWNSSVVLSTVCTWLLNPSYMLFNEWYDVWRDTVMQ